MTPTCTVSRLLSGHETAPFMPSSQALGWILSVCTVFTPVPRPWDSTVSRQALRPSVTRQHRFTPPSQTVRDHPHSLLRNSVILSLRGQTWHSSWHTHCSALHTSCQGLKPIGRLSVVPLYASTYIVSICSFICLSVFGLIPRLALALQRYSKWAAPKTEPKFVYCLWFMFYIVYFLYMLVLICLLLSTEMYVYV